MDLLVQYAKKETVMSYVSTLCISFSDGRSLPHPLPVILHSIFQIFPFAAVDLDIWNMTWLCCNDLLTAQSTMFRSRVRWIYISIPNMLWKVRLEIDARPTLRVFFLVLGDKIREFSFQLSLRSGFDLEDAPFLSQHCPYLRKLPFAHLEERLQSYWPYLARFQDVVELYTSSSNHVSLGLERAEGLVSFEQVVAAFPHLEGINLKQLSASLDMLAIVQVLQYCSQLKVLVAGSCGWFDWRRCHPPGVSSLTIRLAAHVHAEANPAVSTNFSLFLSNLSSVLPPFNTATISVRDVIAGERGATHLEYLIALLAFLSAAKYRSKLEELRFINLDSELRVFSSSTGCEFSSVTGLVIEVMDALCLSRLAASTVLALTPSLMTLKLQCLELVSISDLELVINRLPILETLHISSFSDTAHFLESNFVSEQFMQVLISSNRIWHCLELHYNSTDLQRYEIFGSQVKMFEQAIQDGKLKVRSLVLKQGSILEHALHGRK
ncbi:hypothetical protein EON65_43915 [archaeon]|nr:MAG: hypothetical protein EON65_43915 [archaeon]